MLNHETIVNILCAVPLGNGEGIVKEAIALMPDQKKLQIVITLPESVVAGEANRLQQLFTSALIDAGETRLINIALTAEKAITKQKNNQPRAAKKIIAVGSGKGGVGKSTISLNLAIALAQENYRIGLLDADIYGPSMAQLLGIDEKPEIKNHKAVPIERFGIKSISMGYLTTPQDAVVWRAPMVVKALQQFLFDVYWHDDDEDLLDYLIIDLPPGTGDIPLTLAQQAGADGAVIITTGHDLSLIDAMRAMKMFEKLHVPILGVVENMASFVCPNCGEVSHIFDALDMEQQAYELGTKLLGKIPLQTAIRASADAKYPFVANKKNDTETCDIFRTIAHDIVAQINGNE